MNFALDYGNLAQPEMRQLHFFFSQLAVSLRWGRRTAFVWGAPVAQRAVDRTAVPRSSSSNTTLYTHLRTMRDTKILALT